MREDKDWLRSVRSWISSHFTQLAILAGVFWLVGLSWGFDSLKPWILVAAGLTTLVLLGYSRIPQRSSPDVSSHRVVIFLIDVSGSVAKHWSEVAAIVARRLQDAETEAVGLWSFTTSAHVVLEPAVRRPGEILEAVDRLGKSLRGGTDTSAAIADVLPVLDGYPTAASRELVVITDSALVPKLQSTAISRPRPRDVVVVGHDVRGWRPESKPEIILLPATETQPRRRLALWVLIVLLTLFGLRCQIGAALGMNQDHHRPYPDSLPAEIGDLVEAVGSAPARASSRIRSVEALRAAYSDALARTPELVDLGEALQPQPFRRASEIAPWVEDRLPASWILLADQSAAGWFDCCARASVVLARVATSPPARDEPEEFIVDFLSRQVEGSFDFSGQGIASEENTVSTRITSAELEQFVRDELRDAATVRRLLQDAGFPPESAKNLDYIWTTERQRVEEFESGKFRSAGLVHFGILAVSQHLSKQLIQHPVLELEVVAVGFTDRDTLDSKPKVDAAYVDIPFVPDQDGCPPDRGALNGLEIAPGAFAALPYAPLGTTPWPQSSADFPQPLFTSAGAAATIGPYLDDNCELSFLRGYEAIRIVADRLTTTLQVDANDPRFRFGYSGKGTTAFHKDLRGKALDRKVTFYIRLFQAERRGSADVDMP